MMQALEDGAPTQSPWTCGTEAIMIAQLVHQTDDIRILWSHNPFGIQGP